jgi:hypothetical protein
MHPPDDIPNMDVDGGDMNAEIEPTSTSDRTLDILGTNADDSHVSEAVENIWEEAQHSQYPITIEDYVSDDEDSSDDDGFGYAEMFEDDEMYADGRLGMDDTVNEDFEQELAKFGTNTGNHLSLQILSSLCLSFPQPRKSLRMKLPSFATLHSRSKAT